MSSKVFGNSLISILILILGSWALYEYKQSLKNQEQAEKAESLFSQELEDLTAFTIKTKEGEIQALKKNQSWLVKKPVEDLADFKEISRWFDEVRRQKIQKISSSENINWKEYGLEDAPRLDLLFKTGAPVSFSVSEKNSFDGRHFVKKEGGLFLSESWLHTEINKKDLKAFRSKKLLPSLGHPEKIQWKGKNRMVLHWKDYKWSLGKSQGGVPLDSDKLDNFWTDFSQMEAEAILAAAGPAAIKKYKLNRPRQEIHLSFPGGVKQSLKISALQKERAYALASHRKFIFELSKGNLKKLMLSLGDIRDHSFPFQYKKSLSYEIQRTGKNNMAIKRSGEGWSSIDKSKMEAEDKKVEDFLTKITELKGEKYKKLNKSKKQKAKRMITIKDSNGDLLFELKEMERAGRLSWLKTSLWPAELTAANKKDIDDIFNMDLLPPKKASNKKK